MRSLYLLALTLLLTGVVGCRDDQTATISNGYMRYDGVPGAFVYEFHLADGTRCVAYSSNAITCEWQRPVILVPRPE